MAAAQDPGRDLLGDEWDGLERIVQQFEDAWKRGERPDLSRYLSGEPTTSCELLAELVHVDLRCRYEAGERPRVESYFRRFPELAADTRQALALISWEMELRRRAGAEADDEELGSRFPHLSREQLSGIATQHLSGGEASSAGGAPPPATEAPAAPRSAESFLATLAALPLLEEVRRQELPALGERHADAQQLGDELVRRGWLTPFQVRLLLQGRGEELLLGPYLVVERLGEGGMGVVYEAMHRDTGQRVALKVLSKDRLQVGEALRRFRREVQATACLTHRNIVKIYEARQVGLLHFLVMEYLAGADLQRLVEQTGPLPVTRACDFIRQAALGLQHAQEKGLVHRDIKPSNLMITPADADQPLGVTPSLSHPRPSPATLLAPGALVKILDMGLARLNAAGAALHESWSTLTRAGALIGTPDYMAPEQWEDAHATDTRADLYSLGGTLYFLLTGQVPFPGGSLVQKLDRHRSQMPVPVERLRPEVPAALAQAVNRLLAKRPADRYQSPAEVADVLERCQRSSRTVPRLDLGRRLQDAAALPAGEIRSLEGHTAAVATVAVSPDGRLALSGGEDHTVRLWDLETGRELRQFQGMSGAVKCVAFAPDGRTALTAGEDPCVRLWEVNTGRPVRLFPGHGDVVKSVAFSPDGRTMISGGSDRVVRLWDVGSGRRLLRFEGHTADVNCVAFSPDGKQLLSSSWDKTARLWDAKTAKELRSFGGIYSDWQWLVILALAFSPDGRRFAAGGYDNVLRLCHPDDGRELARFTGHTDWVTGVAFSPDGRFLLSGSRDQTVRVWDVTTGRERHRFDNHTEAVTAVAFAGDGRHAVSAGTDRSVRYWRLSL